METTNDILQQPSSEHPSSKQRRPRSHYRYRYKASTRRTRGHGGNTRYSRKSYLYRNASVCEYPSHATMHDINEEYAWRPKASRPEMYRAILSESHSPYAHAPMCHDHEQFGSHSNGYDEHAHAIRHITVTDATQRGIEPRPPNKKRRVRQYGHAEDHHLHEHDTTDVDAVTTDAKHGSCACDPDTESSSRIGYRLIPKLESAPNAMYEHEELDLCMNLNLNLHSMPTYAQIASYKRMENELIASHRAIPHRFREEVIESQLRHVNHPYKPAAAVQRQNDTDSSSSIASSVCDDIRDIRISSTASSASSCSSASGVRANNTNNSNNLKTVQAKADTEEEKSQDHEDNFKYEDDLIEKPLHLVCSTDTWQIVVNDKNRRSFAGYKANPFSTDELDLWWKLMTAEDGDIEWKRPQLPNGRALPRKAAWLVSDECKCCYRYAKTEWKPQVFPKWCEQITKRVMQETGLEFQHMPNSCNVNWYQDGSDSVGWHSDDEQLFQSKFDDCLIISLSLGQTRKFQLKLLENTDFLPPNFLFEFDPFYKNDTCIDVVTQQLQSQQNNNNNALTEEAEKEHENENIKSIELKNGDLMTMEGLFQKHYLHRVPKTRSINKPRINFTWRWIKQHYFYRDHCRLYTHNGPGSIKPL